MSNTGTHGGPILIRSISKVDLERWWRTTRSNSLHRSVSFKHGRSRLGDARFHRFDLFDRYPYKWRQDHVQKNRRGRVRLLYLFDFQDDSSLLSSKHSNRIPNQSIGLYRFPCEFTQLRRMHDGKRPRSSSISLSWWSSLCFYTM